MSRKRERNRNTAPLPPPVRKAGIAGMVVALLGVAILASTGFGWWRWNHMEFHDSIAPAGETATADPPMIAAKARPEFKKLMGKWVRPDGGYVIDIKSVDDGGGMNTAYFNPNPIHVAKAQASREGNVTRVFIELRDVNYPGSTYNLTYDSANDRLEGIYYQALLQQSYKVLFARLR